MKNLIFFKDQKLKFQILEYVPGRQERKEIIMTYTIDKLSHEDMERILMGIEHLQGSNLCAVEEDNANYPMRAQQNRLNLEETQQLYGRIRAIYQNPQHDSANEFLECLRETQGPPLPEPRAGAVANGYCSNEFADVGPLYVGMSPTTAQRILSLWDRFEKLRSSTGVLTPQKLSFDASDLGIDCILFRDSHFEEYPPNVWQPSFKNARPDLAEDNLPAVYSYDLEFAPCGVSVIAQEKHTGTTVRVHLNKQVLEKVVGGPSLEKCDDQKAADAEDAAQKSCRRRLRP